MRTEGSSRYFMTSNPANEGPTGVMLEAASQSCGPFRPFGPTRVALPALLLHRLCRHDQRCVAFCQNSNHERHNLNAFAPRSVRVAVQLRPSEFADFLHQRNVEVCSARKFTASALKFSRHVLYDVVRNNQVCQHVVDYRRAVGQ